MATLFKKHVERYASPKNLSVFWGFGFALLFFFCAQILSGLWLAAHYSPVVFFAFENVVYINRNVPYGWLMKNSHSVGASFMFLLMYSHMAKALLFRSYKRPKALVWFSGLVLFALLIAISFLGYVLPWGQMSFWAATVVTSLLSALPQVGLYVLEWAWGAPVVGQSTLYRVYILHFTLPFVMVLMVCAHVFLLHRVGSFSPLKGERFSNKIELAPFFISKDISLVVVLLIFFIAFITLWPEYLGHAINYIKADPLKTPEHIVPEWYFLPFYAILRSFPNKLFGIIAVLLVFILLASIAIGGNKGAYTSNFCAEINPGHYEVASTIIWSAAVLGFLGCCPPEYPYDIAGASITVRLYSCILLLHIL